MGILTDRDIAVRAVAKGYNPKTAKVAEAMTPTVVYCYEDQELDDAVRIMEDKQIRRLLVLDRNKRLTGIISLADLAASSSQRDLAAEALEAISEPTHRT
jgi:CBS domain-containing protein